MTQRETHFQLLEDCASLPSQGHDEDWQELMLVLRLPLDYWQAVKLVLDQGGWRTATNSVGYLRTAARRQYRKLEGRKHTEPFSISDLRLPRNEEGERMEHDEAIEYFASRATEDRWETPYVNRRVCRELLISESSDYDAKHIIDFFKLGNLIADEAGLTQSQKESITAVLILRYYANYSRKEILDQPDPTVRKRYQTAYRWISQNHGMLRRILSGRRESPARDGRKR